MEFLGIGEVEGRFWERGLDKLGWVGWRRGEGVGEVLE